MTARELLESLRERGVQFWKAEGELHYRCPPGALAERFKEELKARKTEIVELLTAAREQDSTVTGQGRNHATPGDGVDRNSLNGDGLGGSCEGLHLSPAPSAPCTPATAGDAPQADENPHGPLGGEVAARTDSSEACGWILIESEVLGERVVVALTWEAVPAAQAANPDLVVYGPGQVERLHAVNDLALLRVVHAAKKALGGTLQDRRVVDAIIDEVEGRQPPPNPTVHAMLDQALLRHGPHAAPRPCMTYWLREHAPEVAALWPDAPPVASWFDWECRVGSRHLATLDEAYAAVYGHKFPSSPDEGERAP